VVNLKKHWVLETRDDDEDDDDNCTCVLVNVVCMYYWKLEIEFGRQLTI
jgi:hypothetical protein